MEKATVVYPAIRSVPNAERQDAVGDRVNLLFSGDFFRKGGANVVDAFERLQSKYSGVRLRVCCDERIDFDTADQQLRDNYLTRIRSNEGIEFGRVPRDEMLGRILHETDIYLLPTYAESFGFALLEAMAYGLPVIATNEFAIPEIVDHGKTGFLIDISEFNVLSFVRGYQVQTIPEDFRQYISGQLFDYLVQLIESPELRRDMGERGKSVALSKFAIETRNQQMLDIYRSSIG
jgi:glycosyltransferase involved in cell wall biosynthesis